jgi:hypothetical protein
VEANSIENLGDFTGKINPHKRTIYAVWDILMIVLHGNLVILTTTTPTNSLIVF